VKNSTYSPLKIGIFLLLAFPIFYFFIDVPIAHQLFYLPIEFRAFFKGISFFISPITHLIFWPLFLLFTLFFLRGKKMQYFATQVTFSLLLALGLVKLFKWLLGRARPELLLKKIYGFQLFCTDHHYLSFPSGHATVIFCISSSLIYLFPKRYKLVLLLTSVISMCRIALNYHFCSDILGGWLFGMISVEIVRKAKNRAEILPDSSLNRN